MADTTTRARKMPADRIARARYVSLPAPLDARVDEAADKLHVSRTLLLREAVTRGLKAAIDALRREQRRAERPPERQSERAPAAGDER